MGPKGSLRLLDAQHVLLIDFFLNKTRQDLRANERITVAVADAAPGKRYQLKGTAELLYSGPLFEDACERIAAMPRGFPKPRSVVQIGVEVVFDQSVEAEPSRRIA